MSRFINIPIFERYISQGDLEDLPLGFCTLTKNFEIDKPGMIYKRNGQKLISTKTARDYSQLVKWVNAEFDASGFDGTAWIGYDIIDDKIYYYDRNFGNETTIKDLVSGVDDIKILNFVDKIRFANGLTKSPGIFQHIDRNYFWNSGIKTNDGFVYDDTAPDDDDQSYTLASATGIGTGGSLSDATTYYYWFVPVFDGNQEAPIPEKYISRLTTAASSTITLTAVFSSINTAWNERITAYNIYRATNWGGPRYLILTVSTLDNTEPNVIYQAGAAVGGGLYDASKSWTTDELLNKELVMFESEYNISGNTSNVLKVDSDIDADESIWGGFYQIFGNGAINYTSDFEDSGVDGWALSAGGARTNSADQALSGTKSLKYVSPAGPGGITKDVTVTNGLEYHVNVWVYLSTAQTVSLTLETVLKDTEATTGGWLRLTGSVVMSDVTLTILIETDGAADTFYIDNVVVSIGAYHDSGTTGYAGRDVIVDDDLSLDREDAHENWYVLVGTNSDGNNDASSEIKIVTNNVEKAIKFGSDFTGSYLGNNQKMYLCKNYIWQLSDTNEVTLTIYDTGIIDGRRHPYGDTLIEVNYKYGEYIDGRFYPVHVRLDPNDEAEDHKTWIMFSEILQPDVIPITNYIEIRDIQGGEPKGTAKLLGDMIILMEHGIYRLNIPSANPLNWSLIETEETKGCIAENSIVTVRSHTFFAGRDYFYVIAPNFEVIPISETIKDEYQSKANIESTRVIVDNKKDRLLCRFGDDRSTLYALDLKALFERNEERWNILKFNNEIDIFASDEKLSVFVLNKDITTTFGVEKDFGADYGYVSAMVVYDGKMWISIHDTANNDTEFWSFDGATWTQEKDCGYSSGTWHCKDMKVHNGKLYFAMYTANNQDHIWEYDKDTNTWTNWTFSDVIGTLSFEVYKGKLYAGTGGGDGDCRVYVFDGSSWSLSKNLGASVGILGSLIIYDGNLYAGIGGGSNDAAIWKYDGSSWALFKDFASDGYNRVEKMIIYDDDLYVEVEDASGSQYYILKYDGSDWSVVKNLGDNIVFGWLVMNNVLYYGVHDYSGGEGDDLFYFDGTTWGTYKSGLGAAYERIFSIGVYQSNFFLGMGAGLGDGDILSSTMETNVYTLYNEGGDESFGAKWRSSWINISGNLDRNEIIRRINTRYLSAEAITLRIYANGKNGSESDAIWSGTLTANRLTGNKYLSLRPGGARAKYAMIEVDMPESTNYEGKIERLELEID